MVNSNLSQEIDEFEPAYLNYLSEKPHDKKNHSALVRLLTKHQAQSQCRILDVGCGSGKLVRFLREKGFTVVGLEPSKAIYNTYLKNEDFFFNIFTSEYISQNPTEKFDVVIASDVLEHIDNPEQFIRDVSTCLSNKGILFISTPDTGSLHSRISGKTWHYFNKYHLSLFSSANLEQLTKKYKFSKIASGHITRYHSIYYLIQYLINFVFHKKIALPSFLTRIVFPINLYDNMYGIFRKKG